MDGVSIQFVTGFLFVRFFLDSVVATNIRFSHPPRHSGRECHWVYENPAQLKAEPEHFLKAYIPATRHCSQCGNATLHQQ